ncbi:ester cyclase [Conexibacter stalactiti]|uniref:Ester cyclase n=1 Tax=Conexibacter stalactiti TaxID=1940611 RepID=A0ABU4I0D3_9ACTN|nr:ester cyclase [Conexibacter stalactiti]MDW5598824.1 ester cyclase [Conexibacter stalactiti]MEC5039466.1 ester cyclase [Conexibacter stalactiti]
MTSATRNPGERGPLDAGAEAVALKSFELMERGTREQFEQLIHPRCVNHEAKDEPPASRQQHGPAAIYATALWLREAFAELRWEIHEVVSERDLVVVHCTMSGRHVKPFVSYDADGEVKEAFPPTGRRFATTQTHWIRVEDGRFAEHWANRDDLGTAEQLGWVPPSPLYLVRMALAKRHARRAARAGD